MLNAFLPSLLPWVAGSGKEHDGVDQLHLNQFGPCLWWASAEKGDKMGWEGRSVNWVKSDGFWRLPGKEEVSKMKKERGLGQQSAFQWGGKKTLGSLCTVSV